MLVELVTFRRFQGCEIATAQKPRKSVEIIQFFCMNISENEVNQSKVYLFVCQTNTLWDNLYRFLSIEIHFHS